MRTATIIAVLLALPAMADTPMTAEEFEAYTRDHTIVFSDGSGFFGAEEYGHGRRVYWSVRDGECLEGVWFAQNDRICFAYDGIAEDQCWHFFTGAHGLWARFAGDDSGFVLYESDRTTDPLNCPGPKVGA